MEDALECLAVQFVTNEHQLVDERLAILHARPPACDELWNWQSM